MLGKTVAVLALTASFGMTGVPPSLASSAGGMRNAGTPGWFETNSNAAQSRANLAETVLTPATVKKATYLRSIVSPQIRPTATCPGPIVAPLPADGSLYAITNAQLSKYDPATGRLIWRVTPNPRFTTIYDSLALSGNLVLVGGGDCQSASAPPGTVYAFKASTGALVWKASPFGDGPLNGAGVVGTSFVVTAGADIEGYVTQVLKLSDGTPVWHAQGCEPLRGTLDPVVVGQMVMGYDGCDNNGNGVLQGRSLATGKLAWSLPGNWALQSGDLAGSAGKHLYATNPAGTVVDLNPQTGKVAYSLLRAHRVLAVDTSRVYATCGSSGVCGYNIGTGALEWRNSRIFFNVRLGAEAGGVLYLDFGAALSTATGKLITNVWQLLTSRQPATAVAVGDGRIAVVPEPRVLDLFGLPGS